MGSSPSSQAKLYADSAPASVPNIIANAAALEGQRVHVVGIAAHRDAVMHSPFAQFEGVAVRVGWFYPRTGGTADQLKFHGQDVLSFDLASGEETIRVAASPSWKLELKHTHTAHNIVFMHDGESMGSGGNEFGQYARIEPRPLARAFFDAYCPAAIRATDERSIPVLGENAFQLNRPRKAKEAVLQLGERCAVLGTLRRDATDGALWLDAAAGGLISNHKPELLADGRVSVAAPSRGDAWKPPSSVERMNPRRRAG